MQTTDEDSHVIAGPRLLARIKSDGAELALLQDGAGRDFLWPATPPWPRHAPVLFPIVGRLKDDTLTHRGIAYRMTQHGFARDRRFAWLVRDAQSCRLLLHDDAKTRAHYPFAFQFEITYAIVGPKLDVTYVVTNTGDEVLPASMGAHPAFLWPLADGVAKEAHSVTFEADEPGKMRGVAGGLLTEADRPTPIRDRRLDLAPAMFAEDALILDHPASRWVRFSAPGAGSVTVSWHGFPQLGLWSRPDADFLCVEPWHGMASPADFSGEFIEKPWLMLIPPGDSATASYSVEITP